MTAIMRPTKTCPRCRGRYESGRGVLSKRRGKARRSDAPRRGAPETDRYLGTVVAGDIAIQSVAGMGAMGRVYRAHQRGIDRDVAVKILHRELSSNTQLVARFHREAKIASKLQHPHVVEVYFAGQLPDGALYTIMEFLDGVSLAEAMKKNVGRFPLERALTLTLQICDAVGEAHSRGIVHRDLKPENVMLVHRAEVAEWVKVLDFGIAKLTLGEQSMETAAGLIFGTARYISPEGAQGRPVGPPGDVYAIATMLFEMLAGRTPFEAEPLGLLIKHIHEAPPDIHSVSAAGKAVPEADRARDRHEPREGAERARRAWPRIRRRPRPGRAHGGHFALRRRRGRAHEPAPRADPVHRAPRPRLTALPRRRGDGGRLRSHLAGTGGARLDRRRRAQGIGASSHAGARGSAGAGRGREEIRSPARVETRAPLFIGAYAPPDVRARLRRVGPLSLSLCAPSG